MLKNYLIIAFRNLRRRPGFAFINVAGLAVGMAACLLIGLYVGDELSYDRFHEKADRIHRFVLDEEDSAAAPPPAAPALEADYPALVEHAVRLWPIKAPATVRYGDEAFAERRISFADPAIFDVFSYPMRAGDPQQALAAPHTMVLTASMAQKYFGDDDPVGQSLQFWGSDYEITGVIEDVPAATHYPFDALASFSSLPFGGMLENWTWPGFYTYVLLKEDASASQLEAALPSFFARHTDASLAPPSLQPLTRIHLHSDLQQEVVPGGSIARVYLLVAIALLVLGVACINFMTLATARSAERAREVGMRKALGAHRGQLIGQFLGEAVLLSGAALLGALVLARAALPLFSRVAGKTLALPFSVEGALLLLGLAVAVGLAAGSYPALVLSRAQPARILKGRGGAPGGGRALRQGLVAFQFAVSIVLLIGAAVAYQQLGFLQSKDLGFDQERVLVTEAGRYDVLTEELRRLPGVAGTAVASAVPGQSFPTFPLHADGMPADSALDVRVIGVGPDFIETMGIRLTGGRSFSRAQVTDAQNAFILNEAAAKALGWTEKATGRSVTLYDFGEDGGTFEVRKKGAVIGVTEDFNYASLHGRVEPLVMHVTEGEDVNYLLTRLRPGGLAAALAGVEAAWQRANPDEPFDYFFLDSQLDAQYRAEQQLSRVVGGFTALALFVAALGLFGLAAFSAERRTKEIGIRKALGASAASIVALLSKDFARLVLLAFCVAAPLAYLAAERWLEGFAYRIELSPWLFLAAGAAALAVALGAVSTQALKAARTNPTDALRAE